MLSNDEKIDLLDDLEVDITDCTKCPLCDDRHNAIIGNGSFKADVLIVRDYPEYEEDRTGNLWSSPVSRLFNKILHAAHIDYRKIYTTYLVHCRPPENKIFAGDIKKCSFYLDNIIKIIEPKIIVTCGRHVLHYFLGNTKNVSNVRGSFFKREINDTEILIYPLHHPSAMIKLPLRKKEMFDDLNILFSKMVEMGIIVETQY